MLHPADAVLRGPCRHRRVPHDAGGSLGGLDGHGVRAQHDAVARLERDQALKDGGGRRVGDRHDACRGAGGRGRILGFRA